MNNTKKLKAHHASFPYSATGPAVGTDATLGASNDGPDISVPDPSTQEPNVSTRGKIIPSGIGNTDYVDANTTSHGVFAGNS